MKLEKINKYGLLYHIQGRDQNKKPMLFMAHQDVVPPGTPSMWTHPPFQSFFDGQWLWGRGAADCKSNLIGILSAMEALLAQDFKPSRTIIFSFGFDEETGGYRGAASIARRLEETLGQHSLAIIHDEGGMGISKLGDVAYAFPATAEKGFMDIALSLETPGGHSSRPPKHTAIGIMSELIVALEGHPFTPKLDDRNPTRGVLECEAIYSPEFAEPWLKGELRSGRDFGKKIVEARGDKIRWQIQTSQAVDVIGGGDKDNQLPERVNAIVNYRIAPHDSVDTVSKDVGKLLFEVSRRHGLAISGLGYAEESNGKGILRVETKDVLLPSPVTPTSVDSEVWQIFAGSVRNVFETTPSLNEVKTVIPVGSIATGNSDTAHFWNLSRNIFRFTPSREGCRLGVHTIDERVEMNAHLEGIRVYYDLIRNFQQYSGEICEGICRNL